MMSKLSVQAESMLHSKELVDASPEPSVAREETLVEGEILQIRDSAPPRWVTRLAALFTVAASACLLVIPLMAMRFQSLPSAAQGDLLAVLFGLVGLAAGICALSLDYAKIRALAGFRSAREEGTSRATFWLGAVMTAFFGIVHPLLALGPLTSVFMYAAARRGWRKSPRRREPFQDLDRNEVTAVLSGRNGRGLRSLEAGPRMHPFDKALQDRLPWLATLISLSTSSFLASSTVLSVGAIPALCLLTLWATGAILQGATAVPVQKEAPIGMTEISVRQFQSPPSDDKFVNLRVAELDVITHDGKPLLSKVEFELAPGSIIGVLGDTGSGKSLLLQCLQDPWALQGVEVSGCVEVNGTSIWQQMHDVQAVPSVLLAERPILMQASGQENLVAFRTGKTVDRGRRILEQLVLSVQAVDSICAASDARLLPYQQAKLLCMARAFLMSPSVYLMDMPDAGLSPRALGALSERIAQESRLGRSFVLVTDHRALLELCDHLLVMQEGRVIDFGPAAEIRSKMSTGWSRLVAARSLESEVMLMLWIRNLCKRTGDEGNRRSIGLVASDMLLLSCHGQLGEDPGTMVFEFKHFKGHCILRMIDDGEPLSSATLERARQSKSTALGAEPLSAILNACTSFECANEEGRRVIQVTLKTYDPRDS
jgi:ABC-type multidrug transport system ATPase subunit